MERPSKTVRERVVIDGTTFDATITYIIDPERYRKVRQLLTEYLVANLICPPQQQKGA